MPLVVKERYPLPEGLKCPKCESVDVRRSKPEGLLGTLFSMLGRYPFRCRSCRVKFYRGDHPPQERESD